MPRLGRAWPVVNSSSSSVVARELTDESDLAITATLTATAVRGVDVTTSTTAAATLTADAHRTANVSATTAVTAGLPTDAFVGPTVDATTEVVATLTAAAARATVGGASAAVTVTTDAVAALATELGAATAVTATISAEAAMSRPIEATTQVTATLTAAAGIFVAAQPTVVTVARSASAVRTPFGVKTANGELAVVATTPADAVRTTPGTAATVITVTVNAEASVALHVGGQQLVVQAGLTAIARILGAPDPITPPERTLQIAAEDRVLVVGHEDRTQHIPADRRVLAPVR